jgi:hypothetical protein
MNNLMKKAGLGVALAATALTAAAPADAQRYRRYNRGGGDVAAGALLGGIVGLGVGAAIASNNRGRYYDRGYYNRGYYPAPVYRGYYAPPPPRFYRPYRGYAPRYYAPPVYRGGYYGDPYYGY